MRKFIILLVVLVGLSVFTGCQTSTVEGIWTGVALLVDDGSRDAIEAKLTKIGDSFSGTVAAGDKQDSKTEQPMKNLKIEGQEIAFKLGDKTCKGTFSDNNSKLVGKCYVGDEGMPGVMSFELTKK